LHRRKIKEPRKKEAQKCRQGLGARKKDLREGAESKKTGLRTKPREGE
jgi:hypothetical protein